MKGLKFSVVFLRDIHIYMQGFIFPDDLTESKIFRHFFEQIPETEEVDFEIHHFVLLDNRTKLRDANEIELNDIKNNIDTYFSTERIYLEEVVEVNIPAEEEVYLVEG